MSADDHGSESTYVNWKCRCVPCTEAHRITIARKRAERKAKGLASDDPRHGRVTTYQNYGCRCARCKEARRLAMREYGA